MQRNLARLLVVLGVVLASVVAAAPGRADDIGYAPTPLATQCHVDVITATGGDRVRFEISVAANATIAPTGTVDLAIRGRAQAGRAASVEIWSRTLTYRGEPIVVDGPRLRRGNYRIAMAFTSGDNSFLDCSALAPLTVGGQPGGVDAEEGGTDGLPDTGGPSVLALLAGLVLCLVGAGAAGWGRRRPARATASHRTH